MSILNNLYKSISLKIENPYSVGKSYTSFNYFLKALVIILGCSYSGRVNLVAQTLPVTITATTTPPHTNRLEDLIAPASNKIAVTMILRDREELSYQVKLGLVIEGQGIRLSTRTDILPAPITLSYGVPTFLTGADLSEYINPMNLNFEGITRENYIQEGGLPDGFYTLCFTVLDYDRFETGKASLPACTSISAIKHDPPVILAPIGDQLTVNPQNLNVQWQPRHTGFPTEYIVQIFEFDPAIGLTPDQAVVSTQPFVEKRVSAVNSVRIDAADPSMVLGETYLVRVQAQDMTMVNTFTNNGWSDPQFFVYGSPCGFPNNINANVFDHQKVQLAWQPMGGYNKYVIRYREKDRPDAHWYEEETPLINYSLEGLKDATTYEYQIQTLCGGDNPGEFSDLQEFTTLDIPFDEDDLDCGETPNFITTTNTRPIASLRFGDIVKIAGFDMTITSVSTSNIASDAWEGTGIIRVGWLGKKISCEFSALSVNSEKQVFDGEVSAFSNGLESITDFKTPAQVNEELAATTFDFCGNVQSVTSSAATEPEAAPNAPPASVQSVISNMGGEALPVTMGQAPNRIVLDKMVFSPNGATLDAFMIVELAEANSHLAFKLLEASFHAGGMTGNPRLQLASDFSYELGSNKMLLTIKGNEDTFVSWDCSGLQSISLSGEVKFCRDLIVPVDPSSFERLEGDNFVTGSFITEMPEWGQFTADISMSPFEVPKLEDWVWTAEKVVFDFSDKSTPPSITFPDNYSHPDLLGGNNALWKGFFLETARLKIPDKFTRSSAGPIQVGANNIIIDKTGFTGDVFVLNALGLADGRVDTWAISIDSLEIGIQSNQFNHTVFKGRMEVPAFQNPLGYGCLIQPENAYAFNVIMNDTLEMQAWKAKVSLFADSELAITFNEAEDAFKASARLNGMANFLPTVGKDPSPDAKDKLNIPEVRFQNFAISSREPFIEDIGLWELSSSSGKQPGLSKFPLTIERIAMEQAGSEISLVVKAAVNLVPAADNGFSAEGQIRIISEVSQASGTGKQKWAFKRVAVDELGIDASGPGYEFLGKINFYEDLPVYGSGFRGKVQATFEPKIAVAAVIQFGEVDNFRYWFADAFVGFEPGLALGQSGLAVFGFGGGASYRMRREGFGQVDLTRAPVESGDSPSKSEQLSIPDDIGESLSGSKYVPDKNVSVGIKAMLALGTVRPEVFNGTLTFEIVFNNSGSINTISFLGDAQFLTPPEEAATTEPAIRCKLDMTYDFPNEAFHAELDLFVNVNGGQITGAYPDNLAGSGVVHADPNEWYIHLGTPERRIMLNLGIAGMDSIKPGKKKKKGRSNSTGNNNNSNNNNTNRELDMENMGLLLTAYLNAGTRLPDFPAIPDRVKSILGGGNFSPVSRDDPRFKGGLGIMFGASMELNMPELTFLAFYASFDAGAGFDVMLVDYGPNARCAGSANSGQPVGMNGWYATGQIYAYIEGEIGLQVNAFGITGNYPILEIGAAAVLQARLPNPLWMKGTVGGYYSILDGLISGNCRFEFEAGEKCSIVGASPIAGISIIGSTTPSERRNQEIDVFIRPQVTFNMPMDKIFTLQDEDGNSIDYRANFAQFQLINKQTNATVNGTLTWNDNKDVVAFTPEEILPGNTPFEMIVQVRFQKKSVFSENWQQFLGNDGRPVEEKVSINFTTGEAPDYIPHTNVAYSYPIIEQFNFLRNEHSQGYIQLKQGQAYLFKSEPTFALEASEWEQKVQFIQNNRIVGESEFTYNNGTKRVQFDIPSNQLATNTLTHFKLVNLPTAQSQVTDANVKEIEQSILDNQTKPEDEEFSTVIVKAKVAEGIQRDLKENEFFATVFRTSMHNTFQEKLNALDMNSEWFNPIFIDETRNSALTINDFGVFIRGQELFDQFDAKGYFNGHGQVPSLVQIEADLNVTGDNWYRETIFPLMYQHLPVAGGVNLDWRVLPEWGEVPSKAVMIQRVGEPIKLTPRQIETGIINLPQPVMSLVYHAPYVMLRDHAQYRNKMANFIAGKRDNQIQPAWRNFLQSPFIYPRRGQYKVRIGYVLPGETQARNIVDFSIPYQVNLN